MSTINHGMNVDEVEALGRLLQTKGDQLRHLTGELESALARTEWDGPDAMAFKQQWWPNNRSSLQAVAEQVHGFGQSALNNASEQRSASGDAGVGLGGGIGAMTASASPDWSSAAMVGSVPAGVAAFFKWLSLLFTGAVPPPVPPAPSTPSRTAGGFPGWGGPISDEQARAIADRYISSRERRDFAPTNAREDDWYQCTIWAKARWRQMGYNGPDWRGDGGQVAANINQMRGTADSGSPSVGAIVSSPGHVAVVEQVRTLPSGEVQFKVSEMNVGGSGDKAADGSTLVATAEEFRISGWKPVVPGRYTFAAFPG